MTIYQDCADHLDTYWNTGVVAKPAIKNGFKEKTPRGTVAQYTNVIYIFDMSYNQRWVDPGRQYKDQAFSVMFEIHSSLSGETRDNIVSEVERIMGDTGISGYHNRLVQNTQNIGDSSEDVARIKFLTNKYNVPV